MKKKKHECSICGKKFSTRRGLRIHEKTHKRKIVFEKRFMLLIVFIVIFTSVFLYFRQPHPVEIEPQITIISPLNKTYHEKNILLTVSTKNVPLWIANSFDNGPNITECRRCESYTRYDLFFDEGSHTIRVYAGYEDNRIIMTDVTFTVDI